VDRFDRGALGMVGRRLLPVFAAAWLAGCDPFAASEPEPPTTTLVVPMASTAREVPAVWSAALSARSPARVNAISSEQLVVARAGRTLSGAGLTNCVVDRLFQRDSLEIPRWTTSSWIQEASPSSDTVRAAIGYALHKGEGPRLAHGEAVWTVVRVSPSEWRLWRWDDDGVSDSSMFSFCQGGAP
jgi:hypothetical protein